VSTHAATRTLIPTAALQTSVPADQILHSGNAQVIVERIGQIRGGHGTRAREAVHRACEHINGTLTGRASAFVYEETFGVKDRLHVLVHLRSFDDYESLLQTGGLDADFRNGVLGNHLPDGPVWDDMFVEGSVRELVMQPHRWGMHGSLTEEMVKDPSISPIDGGDPSAPRFIVTPAQAQTAVPADRTLNSATAGVIMRRTADFNYEFRAEARVFARTIAETVNLNMPGLATVFLYEEDFGRMDRLHWYIHMRSLGVYYQLMGLDARSDPEAPRASYIQDWISPDRGGGSWERMLVQGSVRDVGLTPAYRPA